VVAGSTSAAITQLIEQVKAPGTGTSTGMAGITTVQVTDTNGVPSNISYYPLATIPIFVSVTVQTLSGWVPSTATAIQTSLVNFVNSLGIGGDVYYDWLFGPASLYGSPLQFTFKITALTVGLSASPSGTTDLSIAFNQAATTVAANIVVTVI
jgi:hypothetical protein